MKRFVSFVFALFVACAVSGCMFDSDDDTEVKKGVVKGKVSMIVTGDPVANVKVYLVNTAAKVDTVNIENNRKAFVDSALTNASGEYVLNNVAPGKYGVVPVTSPTDTVSVYRFTPSQDSGPYEFSMNGETRTVNFIAEKLDAPGAGNDTFVIEVIIKPYYWGYVLPLVEIYNRRWIFFIPYWEYLGGTRATAGPGQDAITLILNYSYGRTVVVASNDNYFKIDVPSKGTFEVGFSLVNTPAHSKFEYNFDTKTLTRLE